MVSPMFDACYMTVFALCGVKKYPYPCGRSLEILPGGGGGVGMGLTKVF